MARPAAGPQPRGAESGCFAGLLHLVSPARPGRTLTLAPLFPACRAVVVSFTTVHVRRLGRPKKYPARVLSIAHQLDLAILTVVR